MFLPIQKLKNFSSKDKRISFVIGEFPLLVGPLERDSTVLKSGQYKLTRRSFTPTCDDGTNEVSCSESRRVEKAVRTRE